MDEIKVFAREYSLVARIFVTTIGVERERILKYVEYQQRQDSGQAKLEI